uniref:ARAD1B07854p n=1 Tax=Blastobotrys adeninivorans TaxID=409370 RepID=A0A060T559_BLAAD
MKYLLSVAALASLAIAQPMHHVHKREPDVVVVTEHYTKMVTVVAGQQQQQQQQQQTSVAPSPEPQPTTMKVVAAAKQDDSGSSAAASSASSQAPASSQAASSAPAASSSSSGSSGSSGSTGGTGISYTPYSDNGGCKSADEVKSDLSSLQDYSIIRLYGVDCSQVENVANAIGDNQKLFLGLFDMGSIENDIDSMYKQLGNSWDKVDTVSVGNELVNGGQASVEQVGQYVQTAKSKLSSLGYNGPVVAVDTFIAVINNPGLCDHSDYMAVNAHAFFDTNTEASQAGSWAQQQVDRVSDACGGSKKVVITESGWPSQGDSNGKAVPSKENQKSAISSLRDHVGDKVFLFTAFNDMWKSPGYLNCEQYWGFLSN